MVLLAWSSIHLFAALLDANPSGFWDTAYEATSTAVLGGLMGGWAWSVLLLPLTRRALLLFLVFVAGPLWLLFVALPVFDGLSRV